jgi:heme exporter protein A
MQDWPLMIEVIALDFDYCDTPLLRDVSFQVPQGTLLHLKGSNGSGKTTLLQLIAGLHRPTRGCIQFQNQSIENNRSFYQSQLCFVGHKPGISPYLNLKENCYFDLHYQAKTTECIYSLAELFSLQHVLDIPCGLLSAGQKKQVSLMRLWYTKAPIWLLDEPFITLDEQKCALLIKKISAHTQQGGTVIITSHQNIVYYSLDYQEYCLGLT